MMKRAERIDALLLRREGVSYRDLMQRFGIAKSTLWRWLKTEGLVATTPQQMTERRRLAQQRGAAVVKARRLARTQAIIEEAIQEIGSLSRRDLWLAGLALYWGEGSKQKPGNVSAGVMFSNSDPAAIRLFVVWLKEICGVSEERIRFDIYLHETTNAERTGAFWAEQLQLPIEKLSRLWWKRHRPATRRTNVGDSYHGLIRVRVASSSALNRRITGWIKGICDSLGSSVTGSTRAFEALRPGSNPGSPAFLAEPGIERNRLHFLLQDVNGGRYRTP